LRQYDPTLPGDTFRSELQREVDFSKSLDVTTTVYFLIGNPGT
jgi:hypothetical protein